MRRSTIVLLAFSVLLASATVGRAAAPPFLPVQGVLTDSEGLPVEGQVSVTFSIYADSTGGTALWFETQDLTVEAGVFTTYLGSENQLPLEVFRDNGTLYLGIQVESDDEMPRIRLGSIPYSAYAEYTRTQTLADLSCVAQQVVKWDGANWICAEDNDEDSDLLAGLSCAEGQVAKRIGGQWTCADDQDEDGDLLAELTCAEGQVAKRIADQWTCAEDLDQDLLSGLPCADGQVAKMVGGVWTCAEDEDQDILSGLDCAEGQIAKRVGGQWVCADDLTISTFSDEFLVQAGPANCTGGCTQSVDLGVWTFCALTRYRGKPYDNAIDQNHDVWRCNLTKDASDQWQLTAFYNANGNTDAVGFTDCGARCFR